MDTMDKLRERVKYWANNSLQYYLMFESMAVEQTESPIEALMFFELLVQRSSGDFTCNHDHQIAVTPQAKIDKYRVDFLLECECPSKKLVIECDGHEFHERTKQQAARDKKRDRDLANLGYQVRHYTGSEIYRDPKIAVWDVRLFFDDSLRDFTISFKESLRGAKEEG